MWRKNSRLLLYVLMKYHTGRHLCLLDISTILFVLDDRVPPVTIEMLTHRRFIIIIIIIVINL